MARAVLISYAGYPYTPSSLMPDNGLASLAGALLESGHSVKVLDYGTVDTLERLFPEAIGRSLRPIAKRIFLEHKRPGARDKLTMFQAQWRLARHQRAEAARIAGEVLDEVRRFRADFVGFKLWNGDGFIDSARMAATLKKQVPNLKIFGGGPQVDCFEERVLGYSGAFDAVARCDGEQTIVALAEYVDGRRPLRTVPNLFFRSNGRIETTPTELVRDMDSLPLPVYDREHYPSIGDDRQIKMIVIDECRGCPNQCNFCIHPLKSGSKWKVKSAQRTVAEMKAIKEQTGARLFVCAGSNTPAQAALANARAMIEAGLDVSYSCFGHVSGFRHADFELLRKSGCYAIFFGVESGSQEILDHAMAKGTNVAQIRETLKAARKAGMFVIGSVIFPAPFETERSRAETLELLLDVRPDSVPVQFPVIVPPSAWGKEPEKFAFRLLHSKERTYREGMTYKVKLLFPPSYWVPLPYEINGKPFRRFVSETEGLIRDLEDNGVLTEVGHDLALMAHALGMTAREFRDLSRYYFLTGDSRSIGDMVRKINAAA